MTRRVDVPFPEVVAVVGLPPEKPKRCRHPHCRQPLEKIFDMYTHIDGSRKCPATYAEPEE